MLKMLSLHLAWHVWPAVLVFLHASSKAHIFNFAVKCNWTYFPQLNLPVSALCGTGQGSKQTAHVRAGIWWRNGSYWLISGSLVYEPCPGRWLFVQLYSILLSSLGSCLCWVYSAGPTVLWHTVDFIPVIHI